MQLQDLHHLALIRMSSACRLEDLLPSGCRYLLMQRNSLSRYLTIRIGFIMVMSILNLSCYYSL